MRARLLKIIPGREAAGALLLFAWALIFAYPLSADIDEHRYRGGPGDGWSFMQAGPAMYQGGVSDGFGSYAMAEGESVSGFIPEPDEWAFIDDPFEGGADEVPRGVFFSSAGFVPVSAAVLDDSFPDPNIYVFEEPVPAALSLDGAASLGGDTSASTDPATGIAEWTGDTWVDTAGEEFRLRVEGGGYDEAFSAVFDVVEPFVFSPDGGDWVEGETVVIGWNVKGPPGMAAFPVRLEYSVSGGEWTEIADGAGNTGSYGWTVPAAEECPATWAEKEINLKLGYAGEAFERTSVESEPFTAGRHEILWEVRDYHEDEHLDGLAVSCSSGWEESGMSSPLTARYFPEGEYTTVWSKDGYPDRTFEWTADGDGTVTVKMRLAEVTWEVRDYFSREPMDKLSYVCNSGFTGEDEESPVVLRYDSGVYSTTWTREGFYSHTESQWTAPVDEDVTIVVEMVRELPHFRVWGYFSRSEDSVRVNAWLDRTGRIALNAVNCEVLFLDADGGTIGELQTLASPDGFGIFRIDVPEGEEYEKISAALVTIEEDGEEYSTTIQYIPGLDALEEIDFSELADAMPEDWGILDEIKDDTGHIRGYVTAIKDETEGLKVRTIGIQEDTETIRTALGADELIAGPTTLYAEVKEIKERIDDIDPAVGAVPAQVLNRETSAALGDSLIVGFRTDPGLSPAVTVYDPENSIRVNSAPMAEVDGEPGIYRYTLFINPAWPAGEYTIICAEPASGSLDGMVLSVKPEEQLDRIMLELEALSNMDEEIALLSEQISLMAERVAAITDERVLEELRLMSADIDALAAEEVISEAVAGLSAQLDAVSEDIGAPSDPPGVLSLFGRAAEIKEEVSDTRNMLARIPPELMTADEARRIEEHTREILDAVTRMLEEEGILIPEELMERLAPDVDFEEDPHDFLQRINDKVKETREMVELIKQILLEREEPVISSWLESGSVRLRMMVVNPSRTEERTVPVRRHLPRRFKPEIMIDAGGFALGYDYGKSLYYVSKEVSLLPGESRSLEIVMRDIWEIEEEEIQALKAHVEALERVLQDSRYASQVGLLSSSLAERLDEVLARQDRAPSTEDKLSVYETNLKALSEIRKDIAMLEDISMEAGGIPTEKVKGVIMPEDEDPIRAVVFPMPPEQMEKELVLNVRVSNHLSTDRNVNIRHHLPKEIEPEYIVDTGGLDLRFDERENRHYLYREAVRLQPGESRTYRVKVKDIWQIPPERIDNLREHSSRLLSSLQETPFRAPAEYLAGEITGKLDAISRTQEEEAPPDMHIGTHRANLERYDEAKRYIQRLERFLLQAGGSPGMTLFVKDIKDKHGGVIPAAGKRADEEEMFPGLRGMKLISDTIFRGEAPEKAGTWRIFAVILAFLGFFSFMFFLLWWRQSRGKEEKEYIE